MKAKKVYQMCLVLCGLFLALTGIACLVVATLVTHDSDLKLSHEPLSRTYSTQYWFCLPGIAFGGLLMLISPSLHKRKQMTAMSIFLCIPLLTCAVVSTVLHGAAYGHFISIHQHRLFLEDHGYKCSDYDSGAGFMCRCTKTALSRGTDYENVPIPCSQQKDVSSYHGALLALSAVTFALLLMILLLCIFLLVQFFNLQPEVNSTATGRNNDGFSHARGTISEHPSQSSLNILGDRPPSYDSLMTSFGFMPNDMMSLGMPLDTNPTGGRSTDATVNRQARVRYRGQASSRFNHQIPSHAESAESLPNDVFSSDEVGNVARQPAVNEVDVTDTTQASDQSNRESIEGRQIRRAHDLQARQEPQSEENLERESVHRALEAQGETVAREMNSSLSPRNLNPSAERISDTESRAILHNSPVMTSSSSTTFDHSIHVRNIPSQVTQVTYEDETTADFRNSRSSVDHSGDVHDAELPHHAPLAATLSSNSEDELYFDVTQNPTQSNPTVPGFDTARIAVRYRGQVDSSLRDSSTTHAVLLRESEDTPRENMLNSSVHERTIEGDLSPNSNDSPDLTEQRTDSLDNDATEAAGRNVVMELENVSENGIAPQDMPYEGVVVDPHPETISVSSIEVMSI